MRKESVLRSRAEEEMSMYGYSCNKCGCSLDPGEGNICEECLAEQDKEQLRNRELDRMVQSTDYKQMEMEEFLKWKIREQSRLME